MSLGPQIFNTIRLRPGDHAIRDLRWMLKKPLRQWGFRCLDIREIHNDGGDDD